LGAGHGTSSSTIALDVSVSGVGASGGGGTTGGSCSLKIVKFSGS